MLKTLSKAVVTGAAFAALAFFVRAAAGSLYISGHLFTETFGPLDLLGLSAFVGLEALLLIVLVAVPAFLLLRRFGMANLATALVLGALPAFIVGVLSQSLQGFGELFYLGAAAACGFWIFAKQVVGGQPNNSFKPSPLRGLGKNPPSSGGPA